MTCLPRSAFTVHETVLLADRVAVRWSAEGTHAGDLRGDPNRETPVIHRQTIDQMKEGQATGHWQVVDRLGISSNSDSVSPAFASSSKSKDPQLGSTWCFTLRGISALASPAGALGGDLDEVLARRNRGKR